MFNKIIFYEIIKKDVKVANLLMRTSKKINEWIYDNKQLMQYIALNYQTKLEKRLNLELHRCLNLPIENDYTITDLWMDGGYGNVNKISFNMVDDQMNLIGTGVTASSFQLSEEQVIRRLQNPSNMEAATEIKQIIPLYKKAEKYANVDRRYNPIIDLLNNVDDMLLKCQNTKMIPHIIPKIDPIDNMSLEPLMPYVLTEPSPPSTAVQGFDVNTFYQQNKHDFVFFISFFYGCFLINLNSDFAALIAISTMFIVIICCAFSKVVELCDEIKISKI